MKNQHDIPNGRAYAAILAGSFGIALLGVLSILAEINSGIKNLLVLVIGVGPLSGKTIIPVLLWLISWLALDLAWKKKELNHKKVHIWTRVLLGIGILGTFPLFYKLFEIL